MEEALFLKEVDTYEIGTGESKEISIIDEYQRIVLESLFTAFGLDALLVKDQYGGDVDTIHNVRQIGKDKEMEYKNKQNALDYENRGEYNSSEYHQHPNYKATNKEISEKRKAGNLKDGYTGEKIKPNEKTDLDHIVSAKEIHDDPGRVLAEYDGADLANLDENLTPTSPSINRSKKADSMAEHLEKKGEKYTNREKKRMMEKDKKARAKINKSIARKYYSSNKFLKDTATAAGRLGIQMGLRQILGLMLTEVWISIRNEFKNFGENLDISETFEKVKIAAKKAFENIKVKYKEYIEKFLEAGLSGIFSSITTTIINIFSTTIKNIVKCIREIWAGIVQAFNVLVLNPNNYTVEEKLKEVSKIIITTASVLVGTLVKEAVGKAFVGLPFGLNEIVPTFLGTMVTGLMSCTLIYILEKSELVKKLLKFVSGIMDFFTSGIDNFRNEMKKSYDALVEYAAELINDDTEKFMQEMNDFNSYLEDLNPSEDLEDVSIKLENIIKKMGINLPYKGDFNEFMMNKKNTLVFD